MARDDKQIVWAGSDYRKLESLCAQQETRPGMDGTGHRILAHLIGKRYFDKGRNPLNYANTYKKDCQLAK